MTDGSAVHLRESSEHVSIPPGGSCALRFEVRGTADALVRLRVSAAADAAAGFRIVPERVRLAYRYTLSRSPSPEEAKHFCDLLGQAEDPAAALNGFCRVLLNTNEFVYVD